MTLLATGKVNYRARIERAELLAKRFPFANEVLTFYAAVATFQKELYELLSKAWGKRPVAPPNGLLRSELNVAILMEPFTKYLRLVETHAPGPLAAHALMLAATGERTQARTLQEYWENGLQEAEKAENSEEEFNTDPLKEFLSRAFLQPYAEVVVSAMLPPSLPMATGRCPRCNSLPLLGVLRPEGDGGKRFLMCAFCSQEWEFRRIFCALCGEEREEKLPIYVAEEFPHIRVESCETCKQFLRTIDLTKDGNAVPIVDDLAAIPLSLWAEEQGYSRVQANLLGT